MKDRRLGATEPPSELDHLITMRDGYVATLQSLDDRIKQASSQMLIDDLEDKWIGTLRSYEFVCQKIANLT